MNLMLISQILKKIDDIIAFAEEYFIYIGLVVMVFLSFFQVAARNLFSFGFVWADDLLRHLVLWTGFIGASLATREGKHINIDVFTRLLEGWPRKITRAITLLASAVVSFLLFLAGMYLIRMEREFPDYLASMNIPIWSLELVFPITFAIITLRFTFAAIGALIFPEKESEPSTEASL